ncbi:hypothetical protein [Luteimicrobium sp. DT211]|uniref:hypothetical protein n=1 Tax=Luteimicrobium sp. DT211 TaxID=3393412 RepID=UPI003CFA69CE
MTGPNETGGPEEAGDAVVDVPGGPVREALQAAGYTGAARAGRTWTVRGPDGASCVLRVLRRAAVPPGTDDRVARLRSVEHAHLARIVTVVEAGGEVAVVLRGATGTTLRDVLARRGALRAGEIVTIVTGVGHALDALHAAGLTQGAVSVDDVVVDDDGRAHLRPAVAAPPAPTSPASDVRALAALARDALADGAGGVDGPATDPAHVPDATSTTQFLALAALLDAAAAGTAPEAPHDAARLAGLAAGTVTAEPVAVPDLAALAAVAFGRPVAQRPAADAPRAASEAGADLSRVAGTAAPGGRPVPGVVRRPVAQVPRRRVVPPRTANPMEDTLVRARALAAPDGGPRHLADPAAGRRERTMARLRRRRARALAVAGTLVGAVVVVGALAALRPWAADDARAAGDPTTSQGATTASPAPTDATLERDRPDLAARQLTERRGAMLAGATASDAVTVAGSPARAADDALVAEVAQRGEIVTAPAVEVASAREVGSGDGGAGVDVTYTIGAYTLRAKDGSTTTVAASAERTDRLELAWTAHGWRVRAVGAAS